MTDLTLKVGRDLTGWGSAGTTTPAPPSEGNAVSFDGTDYLSIDGTDHLVYGD